MLEPTTKPKSVSEPQPTGDEKITFPIELNLDPETVEILLDDRVATGG